jgi:hypothetical protein
MEQISPVSGQIPRYDKHRRENLFNAQGGQRIY